MRIRGGSGRRYGHWHLRIVMLGRFFFFLFLLLPVILLSWLNEDLL